MGLKHYLEEHERVEVDAGYPGEPLSCKTPGPLHIDERYIQMKAKVASRHETINKRMKQFDCLTQPFRHGVDKHASCFRAVAVITQIALQNGEPLFQVEYNDEGIEI